MTIPQTITEWLQTTYPHYQFELTPSHNVTTIIGRANYTPKPNAPILYYAITDTHIKLLPKATIDLADPELLDKLQHHTTTTLKPTTTKAVAIHATTCYLKRHRPHYNYKTNRNAIHVYNTKDTTNPVNIYHFQGKTVTVQTPTHHTTIELTDPKYYHKLPRPPAKQEERTKTGKGEHTEDRNT